MSLDLMTFLELNSNEKNINFFSSSNWYCFDHLANWVLFKLKPTIVFWKESLSNKT